MGRHSEPDGERRGGLRWKGDTTGSIPIIPAYQEHEGITDGSVDAFIAAIHSTSPPGTDVSAEHARFSWMIERCSDRGVDGQPIRRNAWVRIRSGYSATADQSTAESATDILDCWLRWNSVTDPAIRALHTIWVRHATEASWTKRLDGR